MENLLTILFFGQLAEHVGAQEIHIPAVKDSEELQEELIARYPALQQAKYVLALNRKIIHSNTAIAAGAEIALLPPFSGG